MFVLCGIVAKDYYSLVPHYNAMPHDSYPAMQVLWHVRTQKISYMLFDLALLTSLPQFSCTDLVGPNELIKSV